MFFHYLKTSFRSILKHRAYSLINISGLALGISCCILMFLFIKSELSYDRYHERADRIYRVVREVAGERSAPTAFVLAPTLNTDFPELNAVRFRCDRSPVLVQKDDRRFFEKRFFWADAAVPQVFSFPQISGDPRTMLVEPYTVVITRSTAQKYFGTIDVLNEHLTLRWNDADHELRISGVLEDVPANSHFQFDFLVSFATAEAIWPDNILDNWAFNFAQTYVTLPADRSPADYESRFQDFVGRHLDEEKKAAYKSTLAYLQPITDIHLHSNIRGEIESNGELQYLYIAAILGLLLLLVACINYMNLATARAARRAREIGVRKVIGANRRQLIAQFLGESFLFTALAMLIGLLLAQLLLPPFNALINQDLGFQVGGSYVAITALVLIFVFVGLASGSYPAFFLSAFKPILVLKGAPGQGGTRSPFRQMLVVVQFAISIILIIGTITLYKQLDYVQHSRLGFDKEQILLIPQGRRIRENPELLKRRFEQHPDVLHVSVSSHVPGKPLSFEAGAQPEGGNPDGSSDPFQMKVVSADEDFFNCFGMELAAGRNFSKAFPSDPMEAFILNEAAVAALDWDAPLGKQFEMTFQTGSASQPIETRKGRIVGVVKDAHFESLHQLIEPTVFLMKPFWYFYISVKLRPTELPATLAFLEDQWQEVVPGAYPLEFTFLDDNFDQLYQAEEAWGKGLAAMAILAIFVASLGLLGLISFMAEQRTKEIGIRKVLGSTPAAIVGLLSQEFVKLVFIANLIAWPLAYLLVQRWLENFAYRTSVSWWMFVVATMVALLFAALAVAYRAIQAGKINPVEALRTE